MKQIKFSEITVKNWRCFSELNAQFGEKTLVTGDNETGKSSFASAITWLFNGTDIEGNILNDVVPVTGERSASPTVTLSGFIIDDTEFERPFTVEKIYAAQFAKDKTFKSEHVNTVKLNGEKVTAKKFEEWLTENLIKPEVFNMIFNLKGFTELIKSTPKEPAWLKQRNIMEKIVGHADDYQLVKQMGEEYALLEQGILTNKTASQYSKAIKTEINAINKQIESFPLTIESLQSTLKQLPTDRTLEMLTEQAQTVLNELDCLEADNSSHRELNAVQGVTGLYTEIEIKKKELQALKQNYEKEVASYTEEKRSFEVEQETKQVKAKNFKETATKDLAELENKCNLANTKLNSIKDGAKKKCPTCDTLLLLTQEEILKKRADGKAYIAQLIIEHSEIKQKLDKCILYLNEPLKTFNKLTPAPPDEIDTIQAKISELEKQFSELSELEVEDLPNYATDKENLQSDLSYLQEEISTATHNAEIASKIHDMEQQKEKLLDDRAELNRIMDTCSDFIKTKVGIIEEKLNSLFDGVTFEMFKQNKTNEEQTEVFKILFNGKEYNNELSMSTKMYVSLKITEGLQKAYGVNVPIMIDNMETWSYNETSDRQLIFLQKTKEACPKCGGKTNRKQSDGFWTCSNCNHQFIKTLIIKGD